MVAGQHSKAVYILAVAALDMMVLCPVCYLETMDGSRETQVGMVWYLETKDESRETQVGMV